MVKFKIKTKIIKNNKIYRLKTKPLKKKLILVWKRSKKVLTWQKNFFSIDVNLKGTLLYWNKIWSNWMFNYLTSKQNLIQQYSHPNRKKLINIKNSKWTYNLWAFFHVYTIMSLQNLYKFSLYTQFLNKKDLISYYNIYLNFNPGRLYINLTDRKGKNYLSLSVGLFLKFFNKKRSLKKNKTLKLLLIKFLRKLLIVTGIKNISLFIKKTPVFISEILRFLMAPIPTPFLDPINNTQITEQDQIKTQFNIRYMYFLKSKSYTTMKNKQKGRLKRKIARRIIMSNRISD